MAANIQCYIGITLLVSAAKKIFEADKGPKTIDVSKYPKPYQKRYKKIFGKKCCRCHTLARPINTELPPSKWLRYYVVRMKDKKGANISPADAEKTWEFIVYDMKVRKSGYWDKLPDSEKQIVEASIQKVVAEQD